MSEQPEPHFDHYAHRYREMHKQSVRASGEEPDYFAANKVATMASMLGTGALRKPLRILDFGCGIGTSIPHLARTFPQGQVHGFDVSGESLALAKAANPAARFGMIGADSLLLPDASMDVAMAACVYHHIAPEERLRWTRELKRVLKPGGHVFIFEHNPLNPLTRKVVRDCPFDEDAILLRHPEALSLLEAAGFIANGVRHIVFFPRFFAFMRPLEKLLVNVPLGAQYVVHGRA